MESGATRRGGAGGVTTYLIYYLLYYLLYYLQMESGATRNYEIWNDRRGEEEQVDEADDAMKALEARTQVCVCV
jgi:hypothetical protein